MNPVRKKSQLPGYEVWNPIISRKLSIIFLLLILNFFLGSCKTIEIAPSLSTMEKRVLSVLLHEITASEDSSSRTIFFSDYGLDLSNKDYGSLSSDRLLVRPGSKHKSGEYPTKVVLADLVIESNIATATYWIIFDPFFNKLYQAQLSKENLDWTVESIGVF